MIDYFIPQTDNLKKGWYQPASRGRVPFFVNNKGLKVNAKRYKTHLEKELLPTIESMMKRKDWNSFRTVPHPIGQIWFKIFSPRN